ncbi:MAG: NTP transferase domain-containing protein, partial [Desulfovibrio sp.]|nr:NTP transferase domain-containing protein [Desulfovibrio sp.]
MTNGPRRAGVILAAGKGSRMRSVRPKVMRTLLGEPMLQYVINAMTPLFRDIYIIGGYGLDSLRERWPRADFIEQKEQLGTGHALACALPVLNEAAIARVFVINGDTPLVDSSLIEDFLSRAGTLDIAFATLSLADPASFGRVVRTGENSWAIIEAKDYDFAKYGQPTGEINAGMYEFGLNALNELLPLLKNDNKSGEYYLTDLIRLGQEKGYSVAPIPCGSNPSLMGVNSPAELAAMEDLLRAKINADLMDKGVCLHSPATVSISPAAVIEPGAEISGPCEIYGDSRIGSDAVVESFCQLRDSIIHSFALIRSFSHLEGCEVMGGAIVGPYARLRPRAKICEHARVGKCVELK